MEFEIFLGICQTFCALHPQVVEGRMMRSPALCFEGKVFVFYSRKGRMVFRLGKDYPIDRIKKPLQEFNPFRNKGPLTGWYELPFTNKYHWEEMTQLAFDTIQNQKTKV